MSLLTHTACLWIKCDIVLILLIIDLRKFWEFMSLLTHTACLWTMSIRSVLVKSDLVCDKTEPNSS